jgi:hypothetical protein
VQILGINRDNVLASDLFANFIQSLAILVSTTRFGSGMLKECLRKEYLFHPPHACIARRREVAVKKHGAREALVPDFGGTPAKQTGGSGSGKNRRERPC